MIRLIKIVQGSISNGRITDAAAAVGADLDELCRNIRHLNEDVSDAQLAVIDLQDRLRRSNSACTSSERMELVARAKTMADIASTIRSRAAELTKEFAELDSICTKYRYMIGRDSIAK